VLSLLIWTLIVVTTIKYVSVAMRVDNDGEGCILALMSLLGVKRQHRPVIIAAGLFGAAPIYGDGAITPAISVLSALEGLDMVIPAFAPYVLPASVVILVALFAIQPQGTGRIGRAFGPIIQQAHERGCAIDLSDVTYYVGHETVVPGEDDKALPRWVEALFAFM
jgi:KUP system potassium uptake protein